MDKLLEQAGEFGNIDILSRLDAMLDDLCTAPIGPSRNLVVAKIIVVVFRAIRR
jgi:hypothetical protein